jgi:hypothetical protein
MFMARAKVSAHWEKPDNMVEEKRTGGTCGDVRKLHM